MNKRTFLKSMVAVGLGSLLEFRPWSRVVAFFCITLWLASCSEVIPGRFWVNFQNSFLEKNISDQGPNGGSRAMYWKAKEKRAFTSDMVRDFAKKNSWSLVDSLQFSGDSVKKWMHFDGRIFPLSDIGFSPEINSASFKKFPRWINSSITLYRFKTDWLLFEAGTDISTEINGFVIMNDVGTEMSVYHFWGD